MNAEHLARALDARKVGSGWMAKCPAHDDRNPSLSISEGRDGEPLVHCHAGCAQEAVIMALRADGTWEPKAGRDSFESRIVATYDYTDQDGRLLYQVCRLTPKDFRQRRPDGQGGWVWNLKGVSRVLYHLHEVLESAIVFLVEGEKDVETLRGWGFSATTMAGGSKAPWLPQYGDTLRGREVILIPDLDDPGIAWAKRIGRELCGQVARLAVHLLRDEVNGRKVKDVSDFFEYGGSEVELIESIWGANETRANARS